MTSPRERAAVVALAAANLVPWYEVADLVSDVGSALAIVEGRITGVDRADRELAARLTEAISIDDVDRLRTELGALLDADDDVTLHTVLDDTYPASLRDIYNRPPFLFMRGALVPDDDAAVAVVGTRNASPDGRAQARELATALATRGVTVVSGLAAGIDTEAHTAALDAGGRTVAVMGTGITRVYPTANRELAQRVAANGALLSQFMPDSPPRGQNFPLRNVVTSGMAVGTAVIEASNTSGARMQARLALEHGKRLFLVESLVLHEDWAQKYAQRPGCIVVRDVQQILDILERRPERAEQLKLV